MNLIDRLILSWKTRTDDLWKQQEAELDRVRKENEALRDKEFAWRNFGNSTFKQALRDEALALEALDSGEDGVERYRYEGELRAYRKTQAGMQIIGRPLGIHLEKPF